MRFYGLLHLNPHETSAHNVRVSGFENQIDIYLGNAITLSRSLARHDLNFTLLTNSKQYLDGLLVKRRTTLDVVEIPFSTDVPSGISFYSAHFKIDALRYISDSDDDYAALCDLDVICINAFPASLANIIEHKIPLFYDISDQVIPAYGREVIIKDISTIAKIAAQGRWAGGEFIAGPPSFFRKLCAQIAELWPEYVNTAKYLHHNGDEAVVSAALEVMVYKGERICDAGTLGIVSRFWSVPIKHCQRPLAHYKHGFLLHLPADKIFLNKISLENKFPFSRKKYKFYLSKRKIIGMPKFLIKYFLK